MKERRKWLCLKCGRVTKIRNFHRVPGSTRIICSGVDPDDFEEYPFAKQNPKPRSLKD